MVLCEGGFVASTIASLMMNGVCCVWQMQEEEDRRQAIRQDIRIEYERQRLLERELWDQRQRNIQAENWYSDASSVNTDRRRRKLIADKMSVSSAVADASKSDGGDHESFLHHDQVSSTRAQTTQFRNESCQPSSWETRQEQSSGTAAAVASTTNLVRRVASPQSRQPIKKRKVRIASPQKMAEISVVLPEIQKKAGPCSPLWGDMSSIMDSAFFEEEEEVEEEEKGLDYDATADFDTVMGGEEEITSLVDVQLG